MTGRRITKSKAKREEDLKTAIVRSGFTGFELLQLLCDWYGYREIRAESGIDTVTASNSLKTGDA